MSAPAADLAAIEVVREFGAGPNRHRAVDGATLVLNETSRVGVVGESGSGKSTLSKLLAGLDRPTTGKVEFSGRELSRLIRTRSGRLEFRRAVQFIAQDTTSSFDPRHTLIESVTRPLRTLLGLSRAAALETALDTMRSLSLSAELATRFPGEVSGGQRQRFAIARALVVRPKLLICDEIVSAVDVSVQGSILNQIKAYCDRNEAGLVFVSHGLPATAFVADEIVVMHQGVVVEHGPVRQVLRKPAHAYTASLLAAHGAEYEAVTAA